MQNESVVICNEGGGFMATPSRTPPPRPYTPAHRFGLMSFQGPTRSTTYSAHRRSKAMRSAKEMEMESIRAQRAHLEAMTSKVRLPPLTPGGGGNAFSPELDTGSSLGYYGTNEWYNRRRRGSDRPPSGTRGPSAAYKIGKGAAPRLPSLDLPPMAPYHSPLPDIGRQKLLEEDENGLGEANVDSPPPPTYEETFQVSKWVEQINQETNKENPQTSSSTMTARTSTLSLTKEVIREEMEEEEEEPILEEQEQDDVSQADSFPTSHSLRVEGRPQSAKSMKMSITVEGQRETSTNIEQEPKKVDYNAIVSLMNSQNPDIRLEATKEARTQLSTQNNPNIQSFLEAGILKPAIESLQNEDAALQYEALWIITNIASGTSEDTKAVVESGAVKLLIDLLASPDPKVQEQSLWAIGNIAGDSPDQRDYVVDAGLLEPLFNILKEDVPVSLSRNYAWVLSNLTRHKPLNYEPVDLELLLKAIKILIAIPDDDVRADCLWTLSYITDGPSKGIQMVVDEGMVPQLVEFMSSGSKKVCMPALRVCGNIATGTDEQTESVLHAGALQTIKDKFEGETTGLQKEMAWFVSNVSAGTKEQAQSVVDTDILPLLIKAAKEAVYIVRKEATWAISNLTLLCDDSLVTPLIAAGGIQALLSVLNLIAEGQIVQISLEGLGNILKTKKDSPEGLEEAKSIIRDNGGVEILETFLGSDNFDVHRIANEILVSYFPDSESIGDKEILEFDDSTREESSDDEEEEEVEPTVTNQAHKYMQKASKEKESKEKKGNEKETKDKGFTTFDFQESEVKDEEVKDEEVEAEVSKDEEVKDQKEQNQEGNEDDSEDQELVVVDHVTDDDDDDKITVEL